LLSCLPGAEESRYIHGMRLFFAVPLPREAVDDLRAPLEKARVAAGPGFSFGNLDQLHFTLAFLGEQPETAAQAAAAAGEAARSPDFPIHIAGAGAFPSLARPRVAWLGPHLTVARLRHHGRLPPAMVAILQTCQAKMQASELLLVHSILGHGARHEVLRRFPLDR
jgi:2'-5' RNA ligase